MMTRTPERKGEGLLKRESSPDSPRSASKNPNGAAWYFSPILLFRFHWRLVFAARILTGGGIGSRRCWICSLAVCSAPGSGSNHAHTRRRLATWRGSTLRGQGSNSTHRRGQLKDDSFFLRASNGPRRGRRSIILSRQRYSPKLGVQGGKSNTGSGDGSGPGFWPSAPTGRVTLGSGMVMHAAAGTERGPKPTCYSSKASRFDKRTEM